MGYDVIGDIHGQAGKLEALLQTLGYVETGSGWLPPQGRQAIFLGDLIDRGPEQIKVVHIVRTMVEAGHARCVLGNHEFNAIGFATLRRDGSGEFLRRHSAKNIAQHAEFLQQVGEGSPQHRDLVGWFRTLPPMLDLGGIRAVHAWWHDPHVATVAGRLDADGVMGEDFLHDAYDRTTPEWAAMEGLTKGLEIRLPFGHSFFDHAGVERHEVRTKWWHEEPGSFRDVAIVGRHEVDRVPDHPLPEDYLGAPAQGSPVFVGHYWMEGEPVRMTSKVACLDWSAAKNGPLVAYRWDGEDEVDPQRFVAAG